MQNEAKNQEVFKELFASKTTAKSTLHAPFRLHRNALPLDLQLVLRKLRKRNNYHLVFRTNNLLIKRHCGTERIKDRMKKEMTFLLNDGPATERRRTYLAIGPAGALGEMWQSFRMEQ